MLNIPPAPDYIYVINILYQLGVKAKVDFITHSDKRFDSENFDEFVDKMKWFWDDLSNAKIEKLNQIYKNLDKNKTMSWAFIIIDI